MCDYYFVAWLYAPKIQDAELKVPILLFMYLMNKFNVGGQIQKFQHESGHKLTQMVIM